MTQYITSTVRILLFSKKCQFSFYWALAVGITHYSCLFSCEKTAEYQGLPITFMNINLTFAYSELGFLLYRWPHFILRMNHFYCISGKCNVQSKPCSSLTVCQMFSSSFQDEIVFNPKLSFSDTFFFLLVLSIIIYLNKKQCKKSMENYPFCFSLQLVSH